LRIGDPLLKAITLYGPFVNIDGKMTTPEQSGSYDYQQSELMEAVLVSWDKGIITDITMTSIID
jgi:hypothetical protein